MSECSSKGTCGKSSCEGCSQNTAKGPQSMQVKENAHSRVKKVIGVVSGKGGDFFAGSCNEPQRL